MKTYHPIQFIGLAVFLSLAMGGQSADGRDKKDDKKHDTKAEGRGHSTAPARASSSSNTKPHVASSGSHGNPHALASASHGKTHGASPSWHGNPQVASSFSPRSQHSASSSLRQHHVASNSNYGAASRFNRQGLSSRDPSLYPQHSLTQSSHQQESKHFVARDSHSRSGFDPRREYVSPRTLHSAVPRYDVAQRNRSDFSRIDNRHNVVDHNANHNRDWAQGYRGSRGSNYYSGYSGYSDRGHDYAHHSTWYRSGAIRHHGTWRGDSDWCADRSWDWHHHHRYFWDGIWVIGDYPRFGYDPGVYSYDPQPVYPVDSTGIAVQRALAEQGYYDGPIDGIVGEGTRGAIADFQNDHNLPVSGLIDEELLSVLGIL